MAVGCKVLLGGVCSITNIAIMFDRLDPGGKWSPQPRSNRRGELRYTRFLCCESWRNARLLLARY